MRRQTERVHALVQPFSVECLHMVLTHQEHISTLANQSILGLQTHICVLGYLDYTAKSHHTCMHTYVCLCVSCDVARSSDRSRTTLIHRVSGLSGPICITIAHNGYLNHHARKVDVPCVFPIIYTPLYEAPYRAGTCTCATFLRGLSQHGPNAPGTPKQACQLVDLAYLCLCVCLLGYLDYTAKSYYTCMHTYVCLYVSSDVARSSERSRATFAHRVSNLSGHICITIAHDGYLNRHARKVDVPCVFPIIYIPPCMGRHTERVHALVQPFSVDCLNMVLTHQEHLSRHAN